MQTLFSKFFKDLTVTVLRIKSPRPWSNHMTFFCQVRNTFGNTFVSPEGNLFVKVPSINFVWITPSDTTLRKSSNDVGINFLSSPFDAVLEENRKLSSIYHILIGYPSIAVKSSYDFKFRTVRLQKATASEV